jgi:hypothetical protein
MKINKEIIFLLVILLIGLASASECSSSNLTWDNCRTIYASDGSLTGGGGVGRIISCEEYCNNSKPYKTFCNEKDECEMDIKSYNKYMKSFDGECIKYFKITSDEYDECWNWWMDYTNKNVRRNLNIAIGCLIFTAIVLIINLILFIKKK